MDISKRIEEILIDLTESLSVSETQGELEIAEKIYRIFGEMDYYKKHPEYLEYVEVEGDSLGRKSVLVSLKGEKEATDDTVVLIGHIDTVGISDYGELKDYANRPVELTEKFKEVKDSLPEDVVRDLESGDYLFGRGIFDMKTGDAVIIALMEYLSENIADFKGNIVYGAVCDEEVNSKGMLSLIPRLVEKSKEEDFNYIAMIDTDYMTEEYRGDRNKYVYVGAVGKLMPSFYVVGKETHVGESFDGLDPNQLVAELTREINLNTKYSDIVDSEVSLPPISLKQRDLKPEYTVQTAKTSQVFFNYATHISTPDQVLEKMIGAGKIAFDNCLEDLNNKYRDYCSLIGRDYEKLGWESRVISYDDLYSLVKEEVKDLDSRLAAYEKELELLAIDEREYSLKMVEFVHNLWSNKEPVIVVYFTPPYYPHIYVEGKNEKERRVLKAVQDAVKATDTDYNLVYKKFFPAIADISYASAPKDPRVIDSLKNNMPGYGSSYSLPIEDMQTLDLPVLDIGSFGKDAHKFTERVHLPYSTRVTPELLYRTIVNLMA